MNGVSEERRACPSDEGTLTISANRRKDLMMIVTLSHVALGGAIGACLRFLASSAALRLLGAGFPYGTLAVNVTGSFLMGVLVAVLAEKGGMRLAPFLLSGILGGFTTFSAFSLDAVTLWERGQTWTAVGYVGASVLLSLVALVAGLQLARSLI
jgi:fluoride exporter